MTDLAKLAELEARLIDFDRRLWEVEHNAVRKP